MGLVGKGGNLGIRRELYLALYTSLVAPRYNPPRGPGMGWG